MNTTLTSETAQSVPVKTDFSIWKTVDLGRHRFENTMSIRKALSKAGCGLDHTSDQMLHRVGSANQKKKTRLVRLTLMALGFAKNATLGEIYKKAHERGLLLCPSETVLQLAIWYKNQPKGERLIIAMEPIIDSDGQPRIFGVERDTDEVKAEESLYSGVSPDWDERMLRSHYAEPASSPDISSYFGFPVS
jgi:hypothetical protein